MTLLHKRRSRDVARIVTVGGLSYRSAESKSRRRQGRAEGAELRRRMCLGVGSGQRVYLSHAAEVGSEEGAVPHPQKIFEVFCVK